jgi:hypothetical protein
MQARSSFKLSKSTKRICATMPDSKRHIYKRFMIQAELAAEIKPKTNKSDRKSAE